MRIDLITGLCRRWRCRRRHRSARVYERTKRSDIKNFVVDVFVAFSLV